VPPILFRDRAPTAVELERFRLSLSAYRDGSGHAHVGDQSYPDWRDMERVTAAMLGGFTWESKGIVDVEVPVAGERPFGISCKSRTSRLGDDSVLMELSNSAAYFRTELIRRGLWPVTSANVSEAGPVVVALVKRWHDEAPPRLDIARSSYLHFAHTKDNSQWRMSWFPLTVIDTPPPTSLDWEHLPSTRVEGSSRTIGRVGGHMLWEWYGDSGGQLKYYPPLSLARWVSPWFRLEDPPVDPDPRGKAERYWPELWPG
jgi:hypothetical protein